MDQPPQKRLYIKTYGCQMNVYDSERMADVLRPLGYGLTDGPEDADLVVLNTCHIREKAAEKVYSELGRIKVMKAARAEAGGAMTVAGPAAWPRPKARRCCAGPRWSISWSARSPIIAFPS